VVSVTKTVQAEQKSRRASAPTPNASHKKWSRWAEKPTSESRLMCTDALTPAVPLPQVNEDFFQRTLSGGVITVAATAVMVLLFFSELRVWLEAGGGHITGVIRGVLGVY
jgi:hypothetical protein